MLRFEPVEYLIRCTIQYVLYGPDNDGCAPSNDNLLRVYFVVEIVHRPVIFHIHRDLLFRLAMEHGKRGANLHLAVIRARSKQSSNYAFLGICPTEVVVQDGEKGYWMHRDGGRSASKKSHPVISILFFEPARNSTYPGVEVNPGAAFCMNTADDGGPRGILRGDPGKQADGRIEDKRSGIFWEQAPMDAKKLSATAEVAFYAFHLIGHSVPSQNAFRRDKSALPPYLCLNAL